MGRRHEPGVAWGSRVLACSTVIAVSTFCTWPMSSLEAPFGSAIASFGSGADVQTILFAVRLDACREAIIALRLRSKSVAMSTWPELTAISFAAWVAPSLYFQKVFGSIFHTSFA